MVVKEAKEREREREKERERERSLNHSIFLNKENGEGNKEKRIELFNLYF